MKRIFIAICLLISVQMISAQIITSRNMVVERKVIKKEYPHALKSGYRGFVEAAGTLDIDLVQDGIGFGFDVLTTHGYQCGNWFYIGVGAGFSAIQEQFGYNIAKTHYPKFSDTEYDYSYGFHEDAVMLYSLPVYLDMRLYMSRSRVKPFLGIKAGYSFGFNTKETDRTEVTCLREYCEEHDSEFEVFSTTKKYSGLYTQFGLGLECKHFDFSLNYSLRFLQKENPYRGGSEIDGKIGIVTVNLGVNF